METKEHFCNKFQSTIANDYYCQKMSWIGIKVTNNVFILDLYDLPKSNHIYSNIAVLKFYNYFTQSRMVALKSKRS